MSVHPATLVSTTTFLLLGRLTKTGFEDTAFLVTAAGRAIGTSITGLTWLTDAAGFGLLNLLVFAVTSAF